MGETLGVLAAMLSSGLGGTAIGATRFLARALDPLTLGALRFGIGCLLLLPVALLQPGSWPLSADRPGIVGLGALFFALFPILFNAALIYTTAARGALALSTLPLLTMTIAALLGIEPLSPRKSLGVLVAMGGVALALLSGLASAPAGAWRGDLLMVAGALCMALYNVWSRPLIARTGPIRFTVLAMATGAAILTLLAWWTGGLPAATLLAPGQWLAVLYLGVFGGAATFFLWAFALGRTTPTRVAVSVTVNPVTASALGAVLLGEPIRAGLIAGIAAVLAGIWIASTGRRPQAALGST